MGGDGLPTPRRYVAIFIILATIMIGVIDGAVANVALPSISVALGISASDSVWVITAYQLAVVVTLLPAAALGESYGARRVYISGIAIFTVASALCTVSPNLTVLSIARFAQGIGSGCIMSLGAMILRYTYPQRLLGRAIAWNALAVSLASASAPAVGGLILSVANWPWLFAINLPIGLVVLLVSKALPTTVGTRRPLDLVSVAINGAMFMAVVLGADRMATAPLAGGLLIVLSGVCLVTLIRRERGREAPLVPIDLFRNGAFRLAAIASVSCFSAQMMFAVALPFYLQHQLGQSVAVTGLFMIPWPFAVAFAAPTSARLAERYPGAWVCAVGASLLAIGLLFGGFWPLEGNLKPLVVFALLCGTGFGLFQTANNRTLLLSAPKARSGAAGGVQASARLTGQTIGAIAMALLFELTPLAHAPRTGMVVGAACAVVAGVISVLRAPSRKAE
jgi:DHA2 family multidrug resistance protein-like MFS transporter